MKIYTDGSAHPTNPGPGGLGIVVCDDDNNILNPDEFAGLLENQHNLYLMSLPWPSEDDDEMISSETEVGALCQNSNVENVDL